MDIHKEVQALQSSFDHFVGQIQFSINSFLVVFGIIVAVLVAVGAYFAYSVAKKSAKEGVEAAQKELDLFNKLTNRILTVETSQKETREYILNLGTHLKRAPQPSERNHVDEPIYYGKMQSVLYVAGTFFAENKCELFAALPYGFRPAEETQVIAVASGQSGVYGIVRIASDGMVRSDVPVPDCLYTFQAFLELPT